jgi:hypothetical protein
MGLCGGSGIATAGATALGFVAHPSFLSFARRYSSPFLVTFLVTPFLKPARFVFIRGLGRLGSLRPSRRGLTNTGRRSVLRRPALAASAMARACWFSLVSQAVSVSVFGLR